MYCLYRVLYAVDVCLHYCCQHIVLCMYICKSCIVFAVLPVQCASYMCKSCIMFVYCQCDVSCEHYTKSFVFSQCTSSAICYVGSAISFLILFCYFLLFLPILTSWEWMSTGSLVVIGSKIHLSCYVP